MNATITFVPDGTGHCLYTEAIDLKSIGPLEIQRATTIEFNGKTQRWEVRDANGNRLLFQDHSREVCLKWEHQNIQ
jgi:hypothetical protein